MCYKGHIPWNKGKRTEHLCVVCGELSRRGKDGGYRKTCSLLCESSLRSKIKKDQGVIPPSRKGTGKFRVRKSYQGYSQIFFPTGYRTYVHRRVMEKFLGRKLKVYEHVHHINGNKLDNRIENLLVVNNKEHNKFHPKARDSYGRFLSNI